MKIFYPSWILPVVGFAGAVFGALIITAIFIFATPHASRVQNTPKPVEGIVEIPSSDQLRAEAQTSTSTDTAVEEATGTIPEDLKDIPNHEPWMDTAKIERFPYSTIAGNTSTVEFVVFSTLESYSTPAGNISVYRTEGGDHFFPVYKETVGGCGSATYATSTFGFYVHTEQSPCEAYGDIKELYFDLSASETLETRWHSDDSRLFYQLVNIGKDVTAELVFDKDCTTAFKDLSMEHWDKAKVMLNGVMIGGVYHAFAAPRSVSCDSLYGDGGLISPTIGPPSFDGKMIYFQLPTEAWAAFDPFDSKNVVLNAKKPKNAF